MIYNQSFYQIESQIEHLTSDLINSPLFHNYLQSKRRVQDSKEVEQLQLAFLQSKESYEQIEQYGKYAPDFNKKRRELRLAKRTLDLQEDVSEFRYQETQLQTVLDEICLAIAETISDDIKVDAGNPFFSSHSGCGGSCHAS